jgi:hypothetical protein
MRTANISYHMALECPNPMSSLLEIVAASPPTCAHAARAMAQYTAVLYVISHILMALPNVSQWLYNLLNAEFGHYQVRFSKVFWKLGDLFSAIPDLNMQEP